MGMDIGGLSCNNLFSQKWNWISNNTNTSEILVTYTIMRMMYYSVMTQAYSEKEIPSSPNRSRTYDLPITSSDALPLSYRRLVGAKVMGQTSCILLGFECQRVAYAQ